MTSAELMVVLESAISVIFLILILFNPWAELRLDIFRQRMFKLRDELFDYAADGNIGFNDPAYIMLRQSMNGFIRYGHRLSFFRIVMTMLQWKVMKSEPPSTWTDQWIGALDRVKNDDVKKRLVSFHEDSLHLVFDRLVLGSPILLGLTMVIGSALLLHGGWRNLKRVCQRAASKAVSQVVNPSLLEQEAARCAA